MQGMSWHRQVLEVQRQGRQGRDVHQVRLRENVAAPATALFVRAEEELESAKHYESPTLSAAVQQILNKLQAVSNSSRRLNAHYYNS